MKAPTRQWHPFGRTEEEDLHILKEGGDTGWSDETGRPAPWPTNFLDPTAGWVTATHTNPGENHDKTTAKNPPF